MPGGPVLSSEVSRS